MGEFAPTPEQQAAVDAFTSGGSLTLTAGAGTGKTSTLRLLSEAAGNRRGLYAAFNKAIASDAADAFPANVTVKTTHALAFAAVGRQYAHRLNGPRIPMQQVARELGIRSAIRVGDRAYAQPVQQARMALAMATRFCNSADPEVSALHLAPQPGVALDFADELARELLPHARRIWADWTDPNGNRFQFPHDAYVKMFALSKPLLGYDFLLFDEAQDTSAVVSDLVAHQQANGTQVVVVGDAAQAIYRWRGAVSAMESFNTDHQLQLSQSFRFGPAVAEEANKWLDQIGTSLRLRGTDTIRSTVTDHPTPDALAVLCRTNAGTVAELMAAHKAGRRVAIVGGGQDAQRLAEAAEALQQGRPTYHPELALFPSWSSVQEFCEHDGHDLRPFVRLIDDHGPRAIMDAITKAVPESAAELVVTTAHKSKGREWESVQIHSDFPEPRTNPEDGSEDIPGVDEAMLAYVAVTRAKNALARGPLAWVDNLSPSAARQAAPAQPPASGAPSSVSARKSEREPEEASVARPHADTASGSQPVAGSRPVDPWSTEEATPSPVVVSVELDADLGEWLSLEAAARNTTPAALIERLIRHRREWTG